MFAERFLDTNILVYLFDRDAPAKRQRSREILTARGNVISTQVLQEFYAAATRKLRPALEPAEALLALADFARVCRVVTVDTELVLAAAQRAPLARVSFWDALIVESAASAECRVLLTEDLRHGQVFDGRLVVQNPYFEGPDGGSLAADAPGPRGRMRRWRRPTKPGPPRRRRAER